MFVADVRPASAQPQPQPQPGQQADRHDDGTPIPPAALPRLFERFYRADQDRSRPSGAADGAGLGLAITQAIVQAHGGSIGAASGVAGNTFEITLPRHANGSGAEKSRGGHVVA